MPTLLRVNLASRISLVIINDPVIAKNKDAKLRKRQGN